MRSSFRRRSVRSRRLPTPVAIPPGARTYHFALGTQGNVDINLTPEQLGAIVNVLDIAFPDYTISYRGQAYDLLYAKSDNRETGDREAIDFIRERRRKTGRYPRPVSPKGKEMTELTSQGRRVLRGDFIGRVVTPLTPGPSEADGGWLEFINRLFPEYAAREDMKIFRIYNHKIPSYLYIAGPTSLVSAIITLLQTMSLEPRDVIENFTNMLGVPEEVTIGRRKFIFGY